MYELLKVVKINDEYFEDGEIVAVTTSDGEITIGALLVNQKYNGSITSSDTLSLDTSEKYHQKRTFIRHSEIQNIQKVKR